PIAIASGECAATGSEVEVFGDPGAVGLECLHVPGDALPRAPEIVVIQIEVEQVDVSGRLDGSADVACDDFPRDGQGRVLGIVVTVPVAGPPQLRILLASLRLRLPSTPKYITLSVGR